MSIIVVSGVPGQWSLKCAIKNLAKTINGYFEALDFMNTRNGVKDCYIRLSPNLDPVHVLESINNKPFKYKAFIPDHFPDQLLSSKPKLLPHKLRRKLKIPVERIPHGVLKMTHSYIMTEMQHKYPGLHPLMMKTKFQLYRALAEIVHGRLLHVLETNPEAREKCFMLSKYYRRAHPHFADFQLILSTLHEVEQRAGMQRSQISEKALSAVTTTPPLIDNVPANKVKTACSKYSKIIINKVVEHINQLDVNPDANDTEEDVARKKVRKELKKMSNFVPEMIRQVISNNFVVPRPTLIKMCLYGEPFLPNKELMKPLMKSYHAQKVERSKFMYNMMKFEILPIHYDEMMANDGVLLDCGAKLLIRPENLPVYKNKAKGKKGAGSADRGPVRDDDDYMEDIGLDDIEY